MEVVVLTIGIVSPGAMGSALGRAWAGGGARVLATLAGRSERTRRLAHGLELVPDLEHVVGESDVVVSVCPPGVASDVLDAVLEVGADGAVFADLNAISPVRSVEMADRCVASGWGFVDGSISGGPPLASSSRDTRLYLSGEVAETLAALRSPGLTACVVGVDAGIASAIKMCTASVYKGTVALWLQALETAAHFGIVDTVFDDLTTAFPEMASDAGTTLALATSKSERYVAEMENIAATQETAGTGRELFAAMGSVYRRFATTPLAALSPEEAVALGDLHDVLNRLRGDPVSPTRVAPDTTSRTI